MIILKVSKNVTFTFDHVKLIHEIMLTQHIKTFSGAVAKIIDTLIQVQHASKQIERDLQDMTEDRDNWKARAEAKAK